MRGKKNTENGIKCVTNESRINEQEDMNEGTQDREQNTRLKTKERRNKWAEINEG